MNQSRVNCSNAYQYLILKCYHRKELHRIFCTFVILEAITLSWDFPRVQIPSEFHLSKLIYWNCMSFSNQFGELEFYIFDRCYFLLVIVKENIWLPGYLLPLSFYLVKWEMLIYLAVWNLEVHTSFSFFSTCQSRYWNTCHGPKCFLYHLC